MNIFVSNINYATKDYQLQELFSEFGDVQSCKIITDRETGKSRGFGFVEMSDEEGGQAIESLNGKEFNGKELNVSEAKPREENHAEVLITTVEVVMEITVEAVMEITEAAEEAVGKK